MQKMLGLYLEVFLDFCLSFGLFAYVFYHLTKYPMKYKSNEEELSKKITEIIEAPMRSQISTQDIRVCLSSTSMGEKVGDIVKLFATLRAEDRKNLLLDVEEKIINEMEYQGTDRINGKALIRQII